MRFRDTFFLTSLQTAVRIISAIVLNKIIAIYVGPAGLAIIGQFNNFAGIVTGLASGSTQTGIVKKVAESDSKDNRRKIYSNALLIMVTLSLPSSMGVYFFSESIAELVFYDKSYSGIVQFSAISIIFYCLNMYLLAVLNGLREIPLLTCLNVSLSIVALVIVSILTGDFGTKGAIIGIMAAQIIVFTLFSAYIWRKYGRELFIISKQLIETTTIKVLLKFGGVTLVSGVLSSITLLLVRTMIIDASSLDMAGVWEAASKVAVNFNMLFSIPLVMHYLPKFAQLADFGKIGKEIRTIVFIVVAIAFAIIFIIQYFSYELIVLLFSEEFSSAASILSLVLAAEVFRIIGGLYLASFMANQIFLKPIIVDVVFSTSYVMFIFLWSYLDKLDLNTVAQSYLFATMIYSVMTYAFHKALGMKH
tara:strand:+ start:114479 stop:115735 length:1257 start_codon:yes stop_codon:yes gene_type:complete